MARQRYVRATDGAVRVVESTDAGEVTQAEWEGFRKESRPQAENETPKAKPAVQPAGK